MLLDHRAVVVRRERSRVRDAVGLLVVEESEAVERAHRDVIIRAVYSGAVLAERAFDDADAPERNISDAGPHYKRNDEPSNNVHQRYRHAQQPVWKSNFRRCDVLAVTRT